MSSIPVGSSSTSPKAGDIVALALSVGIVVALNLFTGAILWDAIFHADPADQGIGENATQILTGWGGGIIGVIGALVGYRAGASNSQAQVNAAVEATRTSSIPIQKQPEDYSV